MVSDPLLRLVFSTSRIDAKRLAIQPAGVAGTALLAGAQSPDLRRRAGVLSQPLLDARHLRARPRQRPRSLSGRPRFPNGLGLLSKSHGARPGIAAAVDRGGGRRGSAAAENDVAAPLAGASSAVLPAQPALG